MTNHDITPPAPRTYEITHIDGSTQHIQAHRAHSLGSSDVIHFIRIQPDGIHTLYATVNPEHVRSVQDVTDAQA